jgi:hypothetical protein
VGVSYQGLDPKLMPHLFGTEEDVKRIAKTLGNIDPHRVAVLPYGVRAIS